MMYVNLYVCKCMYMYLNLYKVRENVLNFVVIIAIYSKFNSFAY